MTNDVGPVVPPDMLLVRERRRRLKGDAADVVPVVGPDVLDGDPVVGPSKMVPNRVEPDVVAAVPVVDAGPVVGPSKMVPTGEAGPFDTGPDEDHLLPVDPVLRAMSPEFDDALPILRSVSHIELSAFGHKKTINHPALQAALMGAITTQVCKALDLDAVAPELRVPEYDERAGEPALATRLGRDECAALRAALANSPQRAGTALLRAAALPDDVVGAPAFVAGIARSSLVAYRQAALAHAWHEALGVPPPDDIARERDASAVNLLGTLRELLGIR